MKQTIVIISILILSVSFLKAQSQVITRDRQLYDNSLSRTYAFQSFYDKLDSPANCSPTINEYMTHLGAKFPGQVNYNMEFSNYDAILKKSLTTVNYNKVINQGIMYFGFILDMYGNVHDCSLDLNFETTESSIVFSETELQVLFGYLRQTKHNLILPDSTSFACLIYLEIRFFPNRIMNKN